MRRTNSVVALAALVTFLMAQGFATGGSPEAGEKDAQEFRKDVVKIRALHASLATEAGYPLASYEREADELQQKWSSRSKEYNARLALEICRAASLGGLQERSAI